MVIDEAYDIFWLWLRQLVGDLWKDIMRLLLPELLSKL